MGLFSFASDLFGAVPETDIDAFRSALRNMKYDNDTIKLASAIKETAAKKILPEELVVLLEMRKLADSFPYEEVPDVLMDGISVRSLKGKLSDSATEKIFVIVQKIIEEGKCYSRAQLDITGSDLTDDAELSEAGLEPGKDVGRILSALLDEVIAGEIPNKKEALMDRARSVYRMLQ